MTCQKENTSEQGGAESMDVDIADASNGCMTEIRENGLLLWPVLPQESGEGLPYAPVNFPDNGDIWGWRVGRRLAASGYHLDRYLYLPPRFQKSSRKKDGFASRLSVEQYVRGRFPGTDVHAFFSSFSWRIPSKQAYLLKEQHGVLRISSEEMVDKFPTDSVSGVTVCKAGNRFCSSLSKEDISPSATTQSCDVCCSEPGFCEDCCCILCCKTIDLAFEGYSYVRCEAAVLDNVICGHAAHIICALRSYMAGTVGGSVGLDTEYYCRRCDTRTDLSKHVTKLFRTCQSIDSRDDIEKILNVGACILRGSQKKASKLMLNDIELALQKLKCGSDLQELWKVDVDVIPVPSAGGQLNFANHAPAVTGDNNLAHQSEYLMLEEEIDHVLQELRRSQELEYSIAMERLHAQKDYLFSLYQQVDKEKRELSRHASSTNREALLSSILTKEEQIKCELNKLKAMEKVAKGFGKTSEDILKEHFNWEVEDRLQHSCNLDAA